MLPFDGRRLAHAVLALGLTAPAVVAQTDYYNLDAGRPLRVEDALVIERHAFEWQVAPLRVSAARGSRTRFGIEPELAWGLLPRTQLEVGVPILMPRGGALGAGGVEATVLHALNVETSGWPGLAVRAGVHTPAGPHGPSRTRAELGALATRTFSLGRIHANVAVQTGATGTGDDDASRWSAGLAADHTFVVQAMLVGAEVVVEDPVVDGRAPRWSTALGVRYQVGPRSAMDMGVGRTFGDGGEWFVTMGSAVSFALVHRIGGGR